MTLSVTNKSHEKKKSVVTERIKDAELFQDTSLVNLNIVPSKEGSYSSLGLQYPLMDIVTSV